MEDLLFKIEFVLSRIYITVYFKFKKKGSRSRYENYVSMI